MNALPDIPADAQPIAEEVCEQLLAPFLAAIETALREVAMTESAARATYRLPTCQPRGEVIALIRLASASQNCLALGFGDATATALARRILADTLPDPDTDLIRDSLGELVNVTAGQAKALLHGTPWHFTFGTPRVASGGELSMAESHDCLVAVLATDVGEVVAQLFLSNFSRPV